MISYHCLISILSLNLSIICLCLFFLSIDEPHIIFPYFCVLKSHFTDMNVRIQGLKIVNILTIKFLLIFLHWFYAGTSRCCPLSDCMYGCARQSQSERQRDGSDRTYFSKIQFNIYCVLLKVAMYHNVIKSSQVIF